MKPSKYLLIGAAVTLIALATTGWTMVGLAEAATVIAPSAPTGVTAIPGDGSALVSWDAVVAPTGESITAYVVKSSKGKGCSTDGSLSCTVTGLKNGVSDVVKVRAEVGRKSSPYSTPETVVAGVPTAPTDVSASAGSSRATVSFSAPSNDNGSTITGYQVTAIDSTDVANGGETARGVASPITVTGLTNGDSYTFTVTATNGVGTGPASAPSLPITPETIPGAPSDVTATAGNDQATVTFTAPGGPVTAYLVKATDVTATANGGQTAMGPTSPITVTGLTNGNSYTFTVTAFNGSVEGNPSAPSAPVTPNGPPTLTADGSSWASVAIAQWVGATGSLYGLNINWQVTSSVIGLNTFAENQVDFAASDLPYSAGQSTYSPDQPYQYLPDVATGLAFMFNLVGTNGQQITDLNLDAQVIDDIFLGEITRWNAPSIAAINPQIASVLPDTTILPVYRSDASWENYLLSEYLLNQDSANFTAAQAAFEADPSGEPSAVWPVPAPGVTVNPTTYPAWAVGTPIGQNGPDNAADYVASQTSDGSITYVPPAYAQAHDIPVASLVNTSRHDVQPTSVNVAIALEAATLNPDLTQNLTGVFTDTHRDAYPLSAYSYLVTPCDPARAATQGESCDGSGTTSFSAAQGQELGKFVNYLACAGQQDMALLGYSPLPKVLVKDDFKAIGRLPGEKRPPGPTARNCKNPNIDGQGALPGG